jgi:HEAT repeat protein
MQLSREPVQARAAGPDRDATDASAEGEPAPDDPPASVATLWHEDPELRRQALDEIVERGDGSGVEEVKQVLTTDQEAEVRARAVKALIRIGTPEALEALRPAMSDSEVTVRLGAVDAIASFETWRARALLREALRDPEEQVRVSAAAALRDLGAAGR